MSFLDRYGLPLAVGVGGLGALFLLFKHKKPVAITNLLAQSSPAEGVTAVHPLAANMVTSALVATSLMPPPASVTGKVVAPPPPAPGPQLAPQILDQMSQSLDILRQTTDAVAKKQLYEARNQAMQALIKSGDAVYIAQEGDAPAVISKRFTGSDNSAVMGLVQAPAAMTVAMQSDPKKNPKGYHLTQDRYDLRDKFFDRRPLSAGERVLLPAIATDSGPTSGASGTQIAAATTAEKYR